MKKLFTFLTVLCLAVPALAQDITNHSIPVGAGPGAIGWNTVGPCAVGVPIVGNGAGADPVCNAGSLTVPYTSISNVPGNTFLGNNSGVTGAAQALTVNQALLLMVSTSGGGQSNFLRADGVWANLSIGTVPQGRCTLTSGTAIPTTNVTGANNLYYTPAAGRLVPIWNGSNYVMTDTGGEISQLTTDTTKSPAAVVPNQNYDIFVWLDGSTVRATRGPPWSTGGGSTSVRGTGAGSTALTLQQGLFVNSFAITNGPGANLGTYVCTVTSDGSSLLDMSFGAPAAGGSPALMNVWNAYNRVQMTAKVSDTTSSWTYNSATPRSVNASTGNRINFVTGLQTDPINAIYGDGITTAATASAFALIGFAMDSVASFDRNTGCATPSAATNFCWPYVPGNYSPQLGKHFIQAIEQSSGTNVTTFGGSGSANTTQQREAVFVQ